MAKALCKEIGVDDYLFINTSSDRGIDTLRGRVQQYASVKSLFNTTKVVIMDEFDGAGIDLQNALRAAIEQFTSCRFIFTANHINKIIPPLQSRCQPFNFNMTDKKVKDEITPKIISRLEGILSSKMENIPYNKETIVKLVESFYPDIRKMINLLQQYSTQNGNIDNDIFNYEQVDQEFYDYIRNKSLTNARRYLIERGYNYSDIYRNLYDHFVPSLPKDQQWKVILVIGEAQFKHAFVIDHEINVASMLLEIMEQI